MQDHFIDSEGIRLHAVSIGRGPLVVFCHGFPGLWYSWRQQLAAVAGAGFRAVAFDQRGYGQSDRQSGSWVPEPRSFCSGSIGP